MKRSKYYFGGFNHDIIGNQGIEQMLRQRKTMIMITHNEEIAQMADRIIRIEDGKIVGGDTN